MDTTELFDTDSVELADGGEDLNRRAWNGRDALTSHPSWEQNDPETVAADAISDILTALFGPYGTHSPDGKPSVRGDDDAKALLARALESWQGDAEDYTTEED